MQIWKEGMRLQAYFFKKIYVIQEEIRDNKFKTKIRV